MNNQIDIQKYRGIDIWFNITGETFQCDIDDERSVKKSFAQIKKFIDEYSKDNQVFKSFEVEANPTSSYGGKNGKIVGIRKDGRFIIETKDGKKEQVSDYYVEDFIVLLPENDVPRKELSELKELIEKQRRENNAKRKEIEAKFKIVTLKDVKPNYI